MGKGDEDKTVNLNYLMGGTYVGNEIYYDIIQQDKVLIFLD